jgi:hypothetical protein
MASDYSDRIRVAKRKVYNIHETRHGLEVGEFYFYHRRRMCLRSPNGEWVEVSRLSPLVFEENKV